MLNHIMSRIGANVDWKTTNIDSFKGGSAASLSKKLSEFITPKSDGYFTTCDSLPDKEFARMTEIMADKSRDIINADTLALINLFATENNFTGYYTESVIVNPRVLFSRGFLSLDSLASAIPGICFACSASKNSPDKLKTDFVQHKHVHPTLRSRTKVETSPGGLKLQLSVLDFAEEAAKYDHVLVNRFIKPHKPDPIIYTLPLSSKTFDIKSYMRVSSRCASVHVGLINNSIAMASAANAGRGNVALAVFGCNERYLTSVEGFADKKAYLDRHQHGVATFTPSSDMNYRFVGFKNSTHTGELYAEPGVVGQSEILAFFSIIVRSIKKGGQVRRRLFPFQIDVTISSQPLFAAIYRLMLVIAITEEIPNVLVDAIYDVKKAYYLEPADMRLYLKVIGRFALTHFASTPYLGCPDAFESLIRPSIVPTFYTDFRNDTIEWRASQYTQAFVTESRNALKRASKR